MSDQNEKQARDALVVLKEIKIPPGLRERSLAAMRRSTHGAELPWWRRRVAVPLPAAAVFILALLGLSVLQMNRKPESNKVPLQRPAGNITPASTNRIVLTGSAKSLPELKAIYVSGVGVVSKVVAYDMHRRD